LTKWRSTRVEDAVARLSGDDTLWIDDNRTDRNGVGDIGGPRLAEGALPVLG
jgi:hypothetical protein